MAQLSGVLIVRLAGDAQGIHDAALVSVIGVWLFYGCSRRDIMIGLRLA
jgi:hypothetical protein